MVFYNSLARLNLTPTWPTGERARPLAQGVVYINHKSKGFDDFLIQIPGPIERSRNAAHLISSHLMSVVDG